MRGRGVEKHKLSFGFIISQFLGFCKSILRKKRGRGRFFRETGGNKGTDSGKGGGRMGESEKKPPGD